MTGYFNKFLKKFECIDNLICILGPNRLSNVNLFKLDGVHFNEVGLRKLFDIIGNALVNLLDTENLAK